MSIDAVVFDLGGVLAGRPAALFAEVEQRLGLPSGSMPGLLGMHPCRTDNQNLWHERELGRASALEWAEWYAARVKAAGGPTVPVEMLVASERDRFALEPNVEVLDAVRRLKRDGLRLGLCTNNFAEVGTTWRASVPLELFDVVAVSCELGMRKPDAAMYDYMCSSLGTSPHATVLLDDLEGNVDGARDAGWHGILVGHDHSEAIAALDRLLAGP